jgi:hypothetical protein
LPRFEQTYLPQYMPEWGKLYIYQHLSEM